METGSSTKGLSRRKFFQSSAMLFAAAGLGSNLARPSSAQAAESPVSVLPGYLARPLGNGPFPAVLLVHGWRGIDDSTRVAAQKLVQAGFAVFAPDFYQGILAADHNTANQLLMNSRTETLLAQMAESLRYLRSQSFINAEKIGLVTFGIGDGLVLKFAEGQNQLPALIFYGGDIPAEQANHADFEQQVIGSTIERLVNFPTQVRGNIRSLVLHTFLAHTNSGNRANTTKEAWTQALGWLHQTLD